MWLRIIADQAATAIASARAFEEIDRLRRRLRSDTGAESGHRFPAVAPHKAPLSPAGQALFAGKGWPALPGYEILDEVGRGGMGIVYRARQLSLDRIVAIKVIPLGLTGQDEVVARFHQEKRFAARLVHPNLVMAYDAGQVAGLPFFVMEFVAGANLAERVQRHGPLSLPEACEVIRQAALGLQHIHEQGLVHRDVKPSNLMLTPQGQVKVLDLGVARLLKPAQEGPISAYGQFLGTLDYMAPEQCMDSHSADIRSDIYSLGCTWYFLLAGRPPFAPPEFQSIFQKMKAHAETPAPSIRNLHPNSPPALAAILERMLAKDRAERFSCPAEVASALQSFAAG
jgi:serine/threonine protein kinase